MKSEKESYKEFQNKIKKHTVLIKKLKLLLESEKSIFSKTLIQQNIIFYELNEINSMILSVIHHSMMGSMHILNQKHVNEILFSAMSINDNATLGEIIKLFEKICAKHDVNLVSLLNEYNHYRNNLVHKLVLMGKYQSIKEIKVEAKKALKIGDRIVNLLNARDDQLVIDLHRITYHIVTKLEFDKHGILIPNEPVPTMNDILRGLNN